MCLPVLGGECAGVCKCAGVWCVACGALLSSSIINSPQLTNTSPERSSYFLTSPCTVSGLVTPGGGIGTENPLFMSSLSLRRLCWWSSDSAPVHSKTQRACSLQWGEGRWWTGPGMAKLAALALAVGGFHNLPPLKLRCRQLSAHLLLL